MREKWRRKNLDLGGKEKREEGRNIGKGEERDTEGRNIREREREEVE